MAPIYAGCIQQRSYPKLQYIPDLTMELLNWEKIDKEKDNEIVKFFGC